MPLPPLTFFNILRPFLFHLFIQMFQVRYTQWDVLAADLKRLGIFTSFWLKTSVYIKHVHIQLIHLQQMELCKLSSETIFTKDMSGCTGLLDWTIGLDYLLDWHIFGFYTCCDWFNWLLLAKGLQGSCTPALKWQWNKQNPSFKNLFCSI